MMLGSIALATLAATAALAHSHAAHLALHDDFVASEYSDHDITLLDRALTSTIRSSMTSRSSTGRVSSTASRSAFGSSIKTAQSSSLAVPLACPTVWKAVAAELRADFGTTCNQDAANAIRLAFHDAGGYSSLTVPYGPASGGADGSILLNNDEGFRAVSNPTQGFRRYLLGIYNKYKSQGVGAADLVQFAGNVGVVSCPSGPVLKTVVGRADDPTAAPAGLLPQPFGNASAYDVLVKLFADKGFKPRELAALMGAHSISRAFVQTPNGIPHNGPQDGSPQSFDTLYYSQTQAKVAPKGVYRFDSDVHLADPATMVGKAYTEFANSRDAWVTAFTAAMYKLSVLGIPQEKADGFIDCTSVITGAA